MAPAGIQAADVESMQPAHADGAKPASIWAAHQFISEYLHFELSTSFFGRCFRCRCRAGTTYKLALMTSIVDKLRTGSA